MQSSADTDVMAYFVASHSCLHCRFAGFQLSKGLYFFSYVFRETII